MPQKREYTKIETKTGLILEEGIEKIYTPEEIDRKNFQANLGKQKSEFEEYIESIGQFSFLFYNHLKKINIPNEIKTRFIFLTAYIKYNGNGLLVDTDKSRNQNPLDRSMLKDKLKIKETTFIKTMNILSENKLIIEKEGLYYINDKIVIRGKLTKPKMNQPFTRVFSDSIKELYNKCTVREQTQLYYFYCILPLVNFKYNCICHNPQETELSQIKRMDIKDMCLCVNYNPKDYKKFWKNLQSFTIRNEHVISTSLRSPDLNDALIKVNPKLYYAGNEHCFEELRLCCYEFFIEN